MLLSMSLEPFNCHKKLLKGLHEVGPFAKFGAETARRIGSSFHCLSTGKRGQGRAVTLEPNNERAI